MKAKQVKIKMRPVTTSKMQSMRRSYNRVVDGDEKEDQPVTNPYQSMYAQAFGGRFKDSAEKNSPSKIKYASPERRR
jgi:hypothetical protein